MYVAAGENHSLALQDTHTGGSVWAWGNNASGQLGDGTYLSRPVPAMVPGLSEIITVVAGRNFSIAQRYSDGHLWSWGEGDAGQIGIGEVWDHPFPVSVGLVTRSVAAGFDHALVKRPYPQDNLYYCAWGSYNTNEYYGQLAGFIQAGRPYPLLAQF
jgi:hypothetical protein